ncbi:MAG: FliH/SctL family protein [Planctomycetota bacterium]|jgi:flagellar biosynthesis/type III secretory pathway protein FliH|nr:FliH/SctL family protein [Planctomycetota bacterium]MDP6518723.1 FliH/SctL family protein [Planctomycetota bacterium]
MELEISTVSLADCGLAAQDERLAAAREAGRLAGIEEAHGASASLIHTACDQLQAAQAQSIGQLSSDSVSLALEIVRQLVRVQLDEQRHDLEAMVRETLAQSQVGRGACLVNVSKADAALLAEVPFRAATRIEVDPDMCSGDVHVTTPDGTLVREIEPLLENLAQRLAKDLR